MWLSFRFKDMDLVEQVHIFGLADIHTFEPDISLIRLFNLIFNSYNDQGAYIEDVTSSF